MADNIFRSQFTGEEIDKKLRTAGGTDYLTTKFDGFEMSWKKLDTFDDSKNIYIKNSINVSVDNKVYCFGGQDLSDIWINIVKVYNVESNTWDFLAPMPTTRYNFKAILHDNKIYCLGGQDATTEQYLKTLEVYDIQNNSWETKASMNDNRINYSIAILNDKIYVVSGRDKDTNTILSNIEIYDINSNIWTTIDGPEAELAQTLVKNNSIYILGGNKEFSWNSENPMNSIRSNFVTIYNDNKAYIIGGQSASSTYLKSMEIYDFITETWSAGASMKTSRANAAGAYYDGKIYVIGGQDGTGTYSYHNTMEIYDIETNTWLYNYSDAANNSSGSILAGDRKIFRLNSPSIFDIYDTTTKIWSTGASQSLNNYFGATYDYDENKIYTIGGSPATKLLRIYDVATNVWSTGDSMPTGRQRSFVTYYEGKIYVIGGQTADTVSSTNVLSTVEIYDIKTNTWSTGTSMNTPRTSNAYMNRPIKCYDGKIHIIGGRNETGMVNTVEIYDIETDSWSQGAPMDIIDHIRNRYVYAEERIYVINISEATILIYNISTDSWLTIPLGDYPVDLNSGYVISLDDNLYIMNATNTYEYDITSEIPLLKSMTSLPSSRYNIYAVYHSNKLYVIGSTTTDIYDIIEKTWSSGVKKSTTQTVYGSILKDDKIYVVGNTNIEIYDINTETWNISKNKPSRASCAVTFDNDNKIYLIGGGSYLNTVEIYNIADNTWFNDVPMLTTRSRGGAIYHDNTIYSIGGYNGSYLDTMESYTPSDTVSYIYKIQSDNTYEKISKFASVRYNFQLAINDNKVYCIGGAIKYNNDPTKNIEVYDLNKLIDIYQESYIKTLDIAFENYPVDTFVYNNKIYIIDKILGTIKYINTEDQIIDIITFDYNNFSNLFITDKNIILIAPFLTTPALVNIFYKYNLIDDTYNQSSMSISKTNCTVCTNNEEIYFIGGNYLDISRKASKVISPSIDKYNINNNTYENIYSISDLGMNLNSLIDNNIIYYNYISGTMDFSLENPWKVSNSLMNTGREYPVVIHNDNKIYVIGGQYLVSTTSYTTGNVEIYNTINNTWSTGSAMPTSRTRATGVCDGNKIYVIGGNPNLSYSNYSKVLEIYDISSNTWTTGASMNGVKQDAGMVYNNGKIYVIGGQSSSSAYQSAVEIYDIASNTWTTGTPMVNARAGVGVVCHDNKIYVAGGRNATKDLEITEIYDIETNLWSTGSSMHIPRSNAVCIYSNNKMYMIGGTTTSKTIEIYDIKTNYWSSGIFTNTPEKTRVGGAYNNNDDKVYIVGGNGALKTIENCSREHLAKEFNLGIYNLNENSIKIYRNMNMINKDCQTVFWNNKIYYIGGTNILTNLPSTTLLVYDINTNILTSKASKPTNVLNFKSVVLNDKIYCFGGKSNSEYSNTLEVYDIISDTWENKVNMPTPRSHCESIVDGDLIYVIGGKINDTTSTSLVETYNIKTNTWDNSTPLLNAKTFPINDLLINMNGIIFTLKLINENVILDSLSFDNVILAPIFQGNRIYSKNKVRVNNNVIEAGTVYTAKEDGLLYTSDTSFEYGWISRE